MAKDPITGQEVTDPMQAPSMAPVPPPKTSLDAIDNQVSAALGTVAPPPVSHRDFLKQNEVASPIDFKGDVAQQEAYYQAEHNWKRETGLALASGGGGGFDPQKVYEAAVVNNKAYNPNLAYRSTEWLKEQMAKDPATSAQLAAEKELSAIAEQRKLSPDVVDVRSRMSPDGQSQFDAMRDQEMLGKLFPQAEKGNETGMRDSTMLGFAKEFAVPATEKDPFTESKRRLDVVNAAPFEIRMNQKFNDIMKTGNLTGERFDEALAQAKIEEALAAYGKYSFANGAPPATAKEMSSLTPKEREYWTLRDALENPLVPKTQIADRIGRDLTFNAPIRSFDSQIEEGRKATKFANEQTQETRRQDLADSAIADKEARRNAKPETMDVDVDGKPVKFYRSGAADDWKPLTDHKEPLVDGVYPAQGGGALQVVKGKTIIHEPGKAVMGADGNIYPVDKDGGLSMPKDMPTVPEAADFLLSTAKLQRGDEEGLAWVKANQFDKRSIAVLNAIKSRK